ncbi:MAG: FAD:protein FMN transferase [Candidatus Marinimicrobia bacterium]|nr:FAD:protein FMN transferase [Candidatus Neomarinimicrobiota bacterium]
MPTPSKILTILLFVFTLNCGTKQPIQLSGETMGTTYQITLINHSNKKVDTIQLQGKLDSLLIEVSNIFSTYIKTSELSRFNDNLSTMPINISSEFSEVYLKAENISISSDGSFDFTVLPLIKLWGFGSDFTISKIPSDEKIKEVLYFSGIDKLEYEDNNLRKINKQTQIDFSAIAKGWGVDQVALLLDTLGFENYMVEIGGEIMVSGFNQYYEKWTIGIPVPENLNSKLYTQIEITNLAVATSGSYNNYFTLEDIDYSHILDPITGYPIKHDLVSATIVALDCATADAIATGVMVKGFDEGLKWVNTLPNVECLLVKITDTGKYIKGKSSGFSY